MVKMDARAEEKAPVGGGQLLPVVGNIGFQFPIFLIYPRQGAEYLPGNMRFRTPQRATGQQILHRTIVEHAQDVPPLAEAAAEMRDQHLADGSLIADQLHQLIDAILLKEIFGTLLLQGEAGIEKG